MKITIKAVLISISIVGVPAYSKGLGNLNPATPQANDSAEDSQDSKELNTKKETTAEIEAAPAPAIPEKIEETQSAQSETSKKIANRLGIGLGMGMGSVKPNLGTWTGSGFTQFSASWALSDKEENKFILTGGYKPYAGILKYEDRYYNATMHGFIFGGSYLFPAVAGQYSIRAGLDLGYFLVYAKPQDGDVFESKIQSGKFAAMASSEISRTIWEKVSGGFFTSVGAGSLQLFEAGFQLRFMF